MAEPRETPQLREIKAEELFPNTSAIRRLPSAILWEDEILFGEASKLSIEKKVRPPTNCSDIREYVWF